LATGRPRDEFLPPVPAGREYWVTPTQLADNLGISPQRVGHILKNAGMHGSQDPKHKFSEPYYNKALYCDKQVMSWKYDPDVVCPILYRAERAAQADNKAV
jgi:hypothetical protein